MWLPRLKKRRTIPFHLSSAAINWHKSTRICLILSKCSAFNLSCEPSRRLRRQETPTAKRKATSGSVSRSRLRLALVTALALTRSRTSSRNQGCEFIARGSARWNTSEVKGRGASLCGGMVQGGGTPRLLLLHLTEPEIEWRPGAGFEPTRPCGTEGARAFTSAAAVSPPRAGSNEALYIPT